MAEGTQTGATPEGPDETGADLQSSPAEKAAPQKAAVSKPPAAKPRSAKPDPEMSRRGFFSWAAVAWVAFTASMGGCMAAFNRFLYPNVLFEPPTSFKVGPADDFPDGGVDERFKESNGVWVINLEGKIFALIAICTHLGCPPNWLEAQNKFKCPCHGSGYYKNGVNFEGPTPRPLERPRIFIDPDDGQIVVDKGQVFKWEAGQWDDPDSFIVVS